jgi:Holliday junction DNA helicase RuvA
MIATVAGVVAATSGDAAVVEVGGVGIAVQCTPTTLASLHVGAPARLFTSLVVREDSLTLFGFLTDDERSVFDTLQGVTGVGPRLAQAILGVHSPDAVRAAVATEDLGALTLVAGIGRKTAQRLVLELKDRLGTRSSSDATVLRLPGRAGGPASWRDQLRDALTGLGWTAREVDDALVAVGPEADAAIAVGDAPDVAVLLRSCLQMLSRT